MSEHNSEVGALKPIEGLNFRSKFGHESGEVKSITFSSIGKVFGSTEMEGKAKEQNEALVKKVYEELSVSHPFPPFEALTSGKEYDEWRKEYRSRDQDEDYYTSAVYFDREGRAAYIQEYEPTDYRDKNILNVRIFYDDKNTPTTVMLEYPQGEGEEQLKYLDEIAKEFSMSINLNSVEYVDE